MAENKKGDHRITITRGDDTIGVFHVDYVTIVEEIFGTFILGFHPSQDSGDPAEKGEAE